MALKFCHDEGFVAFINPNKFLSADYAKSLRRHLLSNCQLASLTDVSHLPVFESASVYPVITILKQHTDNMQYEFELNLPITRNSQIQPDQYTTTSEPSENLTYLPNNLWGYLLSPNISILKKLLDDCTKLHFFGAFRWLFRCCRLQHLLSSFCEGNYSGTLAKQ